VNERLVFRACGEGEGCELWISDGTEAGTGPLADIAAGAESSSPRGFTIAGSLVLFSARDLLAGRELWAIPAEALGPDSDGDGVIDPADNCPRAANQDQADADANGIGDACQCGDVDRDGITNVTDALRIARGEVPSSDPGFAHCDVNGDEACNIVDALMVARGEVGSHPEDQLCPAYRGAESP
jgi:ELWxxDGT repeat protein